MSDNNIMHRFSGVKGFLRSGFYSQVRDGSFRGQKTEERKQKKTEIWESNKMSRYKRGDNGGWTRDFGPWTFDY